MADAADIVNGYEVKSGRRNRFVQHEGGRRIDQVWDFWSVGAATGNVRLRRLRPFVEGKGAGIVMPRCNSEAMNMHLEEISFHVAPGAHAVLLLDQSGWHGSAELVVPDNITDDHHPRLAKNLSHCCRKLVAACRGCKITAQNIRFTSAGCCRQPVAAGPGQPYRAAHIIYAAAGAFLPPPARSRVAYRLRH